MIKVFLTVILLLSFIPVDLSLAQSSSGGIKIYSGFLHQYRANAKGSFWHRVFSPKSPQEVVVPVNQCSVEFRSPVSFSPQSVSVMPGQLAYFIKCTNGWPFADFFIKIHDNSDEEYSIDPQSEGKQVGINDEHHITDAYLIYLIMGSDINHLDIVSSSPDVKDKYVLDRVEIHDNY